MRKISNEREKKGLADLLLLGLEDALRDFDASVKAFLDTGNLDQAEKALAVSEEIRRGITAIEVLAGLKPGEVEATPHGGLIVKVYKGEIAPQQKSEKEEV